MQDDYETTTTMAASFRTKTEQQPDLTLFHFVSFLIRFGRLFGFVHMFETATLGEKFETVSIFSVSSLALATVQSSVSLL